MIKKISKYFPYFLLLIYFWLLFWSWINPVDRWVWYAEEWTVFVVVLWLILTFRKFRFSNISYFIMFMWIIIHTIWWHYTFEYVPFEWFNNLFWFERNMFDRFWHFTIWFYAFPIIELLQRKNLIKDKITLYLFWLFSVVTIAWLYEVFEWLYAIYLNPATWSAVLWSQWDIWDAQKDILMDTLWAITIIFVYEILSQFKLK